MTRNEIKHLLQAAIEEADPAWGAYRALLAALNPMPAARILSRLRSPDGMNVLANLLATVLRGEGLAPDAALLAAEDVVAAAYLIWGSYPREQSEAGARRALRRALGDMATA